MFSCLYKSNKLFMKNILTRGFTNIRSNVDKKLKFSNLKHEQIKPKENNINEDYLKDNLYLKIYSCLNKLDALNDTDQELKDKIERIVQDKNITINDEQMMKLITFKNNLNSDKEIQQEDAEFEEIMKRLELMVLEELSEEEFFEENQQKIRFVRPPQSKNELKKMMKQVDDIYKNNKDILFANDKDTIDNVKNSFVDKIPHCFTMRALNYPPSNSEILLVGVQRNSNIHSLYLSRLLENYKPDLIAVHLPTDNPLFINCQNDYKEDWKDYINKREMYEFLINPCPKHSSEVLFSPKKIEKMIDFNFALSKDISISPKIAFSSQKPLNFRNQENNYADAYLTPFIYSFNTRFDQFCPIAICDMPHLRLLEDIVFSTPLDDLKNIIMKVKEELYLHNYSFSMEAFYKNIFLTGNVRRTDYSMELLRQLCFSSKRILFVGNFNYSDSFIESWKNLDSKIKNLDSFYNENTNEMNFIDYIEKLVIIDTLTGSFIHNSFIKCNTFPYQIRKIPTWLELWPSLINVWIHYYDHYNKIVSELPFSIDMFNQHLEKFNLGFENEIDMEAEQKKIKEDLLNNI